MRGNPLPQTPLFLPLGASGEAGRRGSEGRCEHGGRTVSDGRCVGATDGGGFLSRFLWLTAKKETQNKTKNKRPLCNYSSAKRSQRSLGRIPGHAPLPVSFYFHPPFIPLKPTPCLISRPLLPSLSPPPSGLLHKCTHTSARKRASFIWGRRRLSVTSTCRRSDWQGSGNGGKFKNKDALAKRKIRT